VSSHPRCVNCLVEFTTQDALHDQIVEDDEGLHHRECVGVGRGAAADRVVVDEYDALVGEEEERRREMGDPPLTGEPTVVLVEPKMSTDIPPHVAGQQLAAYRRLLGFDRDDDAQPFGGFPLPEDLAPMDCPECHAEPAINGGPGFLCRGRSML
jgi:hypothetical protein